MMERKLKNLRELVRMGDISRYGAERSLDKICMEYGTEVVAEWLAENGQIITDYIDF